MTTPLPDVAALKRRSLRDELAFLLDSIMHLEPADYDRDTLLMRLEVAFETALAAKLAEAEQERNRALAAALRAARTDHELRHDLAQSQAENDRLCRQMRAMWSYIRELERRAGVDAQSERLDHEPSVDDPTGGRQ